MNITGFFNCFPPNTPYLIPVPIYMMHLLSVNCYISASKLSLFFASDHLLSFPSHKYGNWGQPNWVEKPQSLMLTWNVALTLTLTQTRPCRWATAKPRHMYDGADKGPICQCINWCNHLGLDLEFSVLSSLSSKNSAPSHEIWVHIIGVIDELMAVEFAVKRNAIQMTCNLI